VTSSSASLFLLRATCTPSPIKPGSSAGVGTGVAGFPPTLPFGGFGTGGTLSIGGSSVGDGDGFEGAFDDRVLRPPEKAGTKRKSNRAMIAYRDMSEPSSTKSTIRNYR